MQARTRSVGPEISERAGRRVRRLRVERGWSHRELSQEILEQAHEEISPAVLRDMEDGVLRQGTRKPRRIDLGEAAALARTFDVSVDYLTFGEGWSDETRPVP